MCYNSLGIEIPRITYLVVLTILLLIGQVSFILYGYIRDKGGEALGIALFTVTVLLLSVALTLLQLVWC